MPRLVYHFRRKSRSGQPEGHGQCQQQAGNPSHFFHTLVSFLLFSAFFLFSTFFFSSHFIYCIPYPFLPRPPVAFVPFARGIPPSAAALLLHPPLPFWSCIYVMAGSGRQGSGGQAPYCQGIRRPICPYDHLYGPAPCLFLPNSSPAAARHRSPDRVYLLVPAPPVSGSSKAAEASWMFTALIRTLPASEWRNV
ncbi:hypothetical protein IMSAGC002_02531 [Lachnospiraceae bacterium]|nr:hypothetical protein IMSAGC002_02531 [Lachnospiraceae bacterium]